jgi:DNA-binding transcriptional ArsR family regulator
MGRVVDRSRSLAAAISDGSWERLGISRSELACGGLSPRTEDAALRRLTQAGVVTTSVASVAGQLAGDFTQASGAQALGVLYEMVAG